MKKHLSSHKYYLTFLFCFSLIFGQAQVDTRSMNNERMGKVLEAEVGELGGGLGAWQFVYGDQAVMVVTDEAANRMRVFSPVIEESALEAGQMKKMLEANFHSALDAKYSLYEGFVISVFTHPLRELSEEQLIDATRQVVILAKTFGTTYQSTDMIFSPGFKEEGEDKEKKINEKPQKKS